MSRAAAPNSRAPARVITVTRVLRRMRPCSRGATMAPSTPPATIPACTSPITALEVPCWRSESVMANSMPLKAKLTSGA